MIKGKASMLFTSQRVSPIWISEKPAIPTISPASAELISTLPKSLNPKSLVILPLLTTPSALIQATWSWDLTTPLTILPITILPTYSL